MHKAVIVGGSGFIGRPLAGRLLAHGIAPVVMTRTRSAALLPDGASSVTADRTDPSGLAAHVAETGARTVIDLIAMTARETTPLLAALAGRIDHYVMISSADVYRNYEGMHRKATPEPLLDPLAEDSFLRTIRYPYAKPDGTPVFNHISADYDKIPIEEAVRTQTGFAWTVARLPMIFGPGDKQRRFAPIIWRMLMNRPVIALEERMAAWPSTYGFVENVAEGIALIAAKPQKSSGEIFNIGERTPWSILDIHNQLAHTTGWTGTLITRPTEDLPPHLSGFSKAINVAYPLGLSTEKIRNRLDYREPVGLEKALAATMADEQARGMPEYLTDQFAIEDEALCS